MLAVSGLILMLMAQGAPAAAHNNRTAFFGVFGGYDVVATVADIDRGSEVGLLFEITVRTENERRPVEGATVTVTGRAGGRRAGPLAAEEFGGTYRVLLPGRDVEAWDLEVVIEGTDGRVEITETVPGPVELHGGVIVDSGSDPATGMWVALAVALALALVVPGAVGSSSVASRVLLVGAVVLLAASSVVAVGAWTGAAPEVGTRLLGLVPILGGAGALLVGVVLDRRGRPDALALVFAGAAALAVVAGWLERDAIFDRYVETGLSPGLTRAAVAVVLGSGVGLAVVALIRTARTMRDASGPSA